MNAPSELDEYQRHALWVARGLAVAGVPIFAAYPDPSKGVGFALPRGWDSTTTTESHRAIEAWRPGMALCAVMGGTLDLIDFDPHNGSPDPSSIPFAWPTAYATADTPSGGRHAFVAALRVGSRDNILPGVDVKGGRPDGSGRGFAFIAPTVRVSKVDGSRRAYVWTGEPDVESLAALASRDRSGEQLAAYVASKLSNGARSNGSAPMASTPVLTWAGTTREVELFRPPARTFTYAEANEFCRPAIERLRSAPDGARNSALNEAAKTLSHFVDVPGFWSSETAVEWLLAATPEKTPGTGRRAWDARATIASAFRSAEHDWRAEHVEQGARFPVAGAPVALNGSNGVGGQQIAVRSRWVDLAPYLDGSYVPPAPSVGVNRAGDGAQMLYPGAWHTLIGTTGTGKTWLALAHVRDELLRVDGTGHVVYAHFEESGPPRTLDRLLALGLTADVIRERFHWFDTNESCAPGEFAAWLACLPAVPRLVILDGINSACTTHQQDPQSVQSVGWYRGMFVTPATSLGAAVLSLGHPTKAKDRQAERHGFGSTAWLDEADGVGFRLERDPGSPIGRGMSGRAYLSSVKDRYGQVELLGRSSDRDGWHYLGSLIVDNATDPSGKRTEIRVTMPRPGEREATEQLDPITVLAGEIERVLVDRESGAYETQAELEDWLQERGIRYSKAHVGPALGELAGRGRLARDPATGVGRSRGGCLIRQDDELAADATQGEK